MQVADAGLLHQPVYTACSYLAARSGWEKEHLESRSWHTHGLLHNRAKQNEGMAEDTTELVRVELHAAGTTMSHQPFDYAKLFRLEIKSSFSAFCFTSGT